CYPLLSLLKKLKKESGIILENSELLQHEIDHLDGILMTHRMSESVSAT
ncbi:MAG: hypothetical protein GY726_07875, partial [Proteobacteria bacterium]|nr:hypothetical protein [Pseudomonadota bacterium]